MFLVIFNLLDLLGRNFHTTSKCFTLPWFKKCNYNIPSTLPVDFLHFKRKSTIIFNAIMVVSFSLNSEGHHSCQWIKFLWEQ